MKYSIGASRFTGKLKLARDFVEELYVHMGYQAPSAYETLFEFVFDKGNLVSITDHSESNAKKRGSFKERFGGSGNIIRDIEDAFSLDFDKE